MVQFFDDYDEKYPDLVIDIVEFFSFKNRAYINECKKSERLGPIFYFIERYKNTDPSKEHYPVQPSIVERICSKLCTLGLMERLRSNFKMAEFDDFLHSLDITTWSDEISRKRTSQILNSLVYGFEYIYKTYKTKVKPILFEAADGSITVGSGFEIFGGIATAKHCLEGSKSIAIQGYSADILSKAKILTHPNKNIDIAFIDIGDKEQISPYVAEAKILDDVLVMGYPRVPMFTDFLTAERATISSQATGRITPTVGNIAAQGDTIQRTSLFLITARIKGGNSGGPVINSRGEVVAIACADTDLSEGDYDKLGYGVATPAKYLLEIMNNPVIDELTGIVIFKNFDT